MRSLSDERIVGQFMKVVHITSSVKLKDQVLQLEVGDMRVNEDVSPVLSISNIYQLRTDFAEDKREMV